MKIVRINDKIWFGKHKGIRICDVINHDPSFVKKLIDSKFIELDDKTKSHFDKVNDDKSKCSIPRQVIGQPVDRIINEQPYSRYTFTLLSNLFISKYEVFGIVINKIFLTLDQETLNTIHNNIMRKIDPLLQEGTDYFIEFRFKKILGSLEDIECRVSTGNITIISCNAC